MKITILESAKDDLKEGYYFYELQERGVGRYFLDSISADIESLRLFAGIHSIHFGKYHRLLSKRFPFAVYYRVEGRKSEYMLWLIVEETPPGYVKGFKKNTETFATRIAGITGQAMPFTPPVRLFCRSRPRKSGRRGIL